MPRATPPGAPPRPRAEPPGALAVGAARCLSSPRWAMVGCCVCASPGRWASPSTGVRADACRGQPEVDGSAVQDGGGDPIGGGAVDGALVCRSLLETVAQARLRPATWTNYLYAVRVHIGPSLGSVRLRSLTPALVRRFLAERTEAGLAANSVRIIHATLRTMLAEAVRDELGEREVASIVRGPRIDHEKVARGHSTKLRRS